MDSIGLTVFHISWAYQILASKTVDNRVPRITEARIIEVRLYYSFILGSVIKIYLLSFIGENVVVFVTTKLYLYIHH